MAKAMPGFSVFVASGSRESHSPPAQPAWGWNVAAGNLKPVGVPTTRLDSDQPRPRPAHSAAIGRLFPMRVPCSNACANCKTAKSCWCRPTICNPTGRPSGVNPAGTEIAG